MRVVKVDFPVRKRNRLEEYDYSLNGAYFVTICAKDHKALFGHVGATDPGRPLLRLSKQGKIIEDYIAHINANVVVPNI